MYGTKAKAKPCEFIQGLLAVLCGRSLPLVSRLLPFCIVVGALILSQLSAGAASGEYQDFCKVAGIDMIGEKITEINITSPTCIAEINKIHDVDVGKMFWEQLK